MSSEGSYSRRWGRRASPSPGSSAPEAESSLAGQRGFPPSISTSTSNASSSSSSIHSIPSSSASASSSTARKTQHSPHKILHDLLLFSPQSRRGWFNSTAHATVLRQLFFTLWAKPEWYELYELQKSSEGRKMPISKNIADWIGSDEQGFDRPWSLSDYQASVRDSDIRPGRVCGKVLQRFERTYTCKTCAIDASCVLCVDCFKAADHEGHEVLFGQSFSFAAACDCGEPSAWKKGCNNGCSHHPPVPPDQKPKLPPYGQLSTNPAINEEVIQAIYETLVIVIEFIISTLEHSPLPSEHSVLPKNQEEMLAGFGHTGDAKESRGKGPWSVTIWSDERHVGNEITRQMRDATGMSWETALQLTKETEEFGRRCIFTSNNPIVAFHTASMFQQIDFNVTLRLGPDVFKEELVGVLISWLADMSKSTIGGDEDVFRRVLAYVVNESRRGKPVGQGTPLARDLHDLLRGRPARRMNWLMQLDCRLWKKAKWELRKVYADLYNLDWNVRKELACRFAENYVKLFEHYLFHDRELDTNLLFSIAYMVFGHGPACAYASEKANLFMTIIDVAQAWYTNQETEQRLSIPPKTLARLDTDTPPFRSKKGITVFAHIRVMFRHDEMQKLIVSRPDMFGRAVELFNLFVGIQPQKREQDEHVEYEVDWPRSFAMMGELAKCCRELGESFRISTPDQLLHSLGFVATRIIHDLTLVSTTLDKTKYVRPSEHKVDNVLIPGASFVLIKNYMLKTQAFSFHHYLHLLFAEMIKSVQIAIPFENGKFHDMDLAYLFDRFIFGSPSATDGEMMKLILIEWPMQKHVILSQIRADLWKKNGVSMRGQWHHYREVGVREATIDQEFFLLQIALCIIDPLKFFTALIDRFGLTRFFTGVVADPSVWENDDAEPKQMIALLEDLVALVIHFVTDTASITSWDQERVTRKHIVHQLALNNLSYSELIKKLPERSTERSSIIPILDAVSDFKPPTETVRGSYTLKEELYDEVDPYWRHYTRNEQRLATTNLISRAKKTDSKAEPLLLPRPLELPPSGGPYGPLVNFLETRVVSDIVYWIMAHCMPIADLNAWPGLAVGKTEAPQLENLLDLSLHLSMIALAHAPKEFAKNSVNIIQTSGAMSIFQNLWFMQHTEAFKSFKPKVDYILETVVSHLPESITVDYRAARDASSKAKLESKDMPSPKSEAKSAAAARQQALLAEFAKAQASFAASYMDEEDDDDEDIAEEEEDQQDEGYGSCIVCQEQVTPKRSGGMLALLQPSRIIREAVHDRDWFEESLATPVCLDEATRITRYGLGTTGEPTSTDGYPASSLRFGVYMSACSHLMHETCMATYFDATRWRHTQQVQRHHPENAVRMEYLCPLCKSLGNCLIPVDPTHTKLRPPTMKAGRLPTLSEKIRSVSEEGLIRVSDSARIWDHHVETGELMPWFTDINFAQSTLDPDHRRLVMRPISRMIERMRNLIRPLSEQSQRIRKSKQNMYLPDEVVSYTVSVCEIAQRGIVTRPNALTVAEQVPEMATTLIKRLIGVLQLELDIYFGPKFDRTALRVGIFARFLPDWYRASTLPSPLLLRNPLGIVVETAAIAPDLLQPVIIMAYYAELTRTMLGFSIFLKRTLASRQPPQPRSSPPIEPQLDDAMSLFSGFRSIMTMVLKDAGPFTDTEGVLSLVSDRMLAKILYSHTLPFLRRAAIIVYASSGAYPQPTASAGFTDKTCEYSKLLALLAIPRPKETLSNPTSTESPIVGRWLAQWGMQGRIIPTLEFPGIYELVRLPEKWEDMVIHYANVRCEKCNTRPLYPALCLFCGKFVCLGGDCCAEGEQGECNIHMRDCGGAVGMFVDIKRWVLLYLYAGSGSFTHMPYLDTHGELDISMRRGHRQHLHNGRWDELRKTVWLAHTIPHFTARRLEMTSDGGGWGCL